MLDLDVTGSQTDFFTLVDSQDSQILWYEEKFEDIGSTRGKNFFIDRRQILVMQVPKALKDVS